MSDPPGADGRGGPQIIPRPQLWTPGRPAPWSQLGETSGLIVPDRVRAAVPATREGRPSPVRELGASPSAVLVPVAELLAPEVFREERWGTGEWSRPVYFFELVGDTVWGATAALLRQLLSRVLQVEHGGPDENDPAHMAPTDYQIPPGFEDEVV